MRSNETLRNSLIQAARCKQAKHSAFVQAIVEGYAERAAIQQYVAQTWAIANQFPMRLAAVLAHCDSAPIRQSVLQNLLEEEGVVSYQQGAIRCDPARSHGAICAKLAHAFGVDQCAELSMDTWLDQQLASGRWRTGFAYMGLGFEFNVPETFERIAQGLRNHYGLDEAALEYLTLHGEADCRHGDEALELLLRACQTDEHADQAVQGARRGAMSWYLFHQRFQTQKLAAKAV